MVARYLRVMTSWQKWRAKLHGMAKTAEHKLAVAKRIYDIVVGRHGLSPGDLIFDPLTFTIEKDD